MTLKKRVVIVWSALLVVGLAAPGTVGATAGAPAGATPIDSCTTIDEPGTYELTEDIEAVEGEDSCIRIAADDVRLDGNGHVVEGANRQGMGISGDGSNVTLTNVTVRGFETGIGGLDRIEDSEITENEFGIRLGSARIEDSEITENEIGIWGGDSASVTVVDSRIASNDQDGVQLWVSASAVIRRTEIINNGRGIHGWISGPITLEGNHIAGNGIGVSGMEVWATFRDNVIRNNSEGVNFVLSAPDFSGDRITDNGVGISVEGTINATDIVVSNNTEDGIHIDYVEFIDYGGATVIDSVITDNGRDGIESLNDDPITVHGSVIADNGDYGVTASSISNATGNYWGADDGPSGGATDPVTGAVANGSGDEVSSGVHFDPYLAEDPRASNGTDDGTEVYQIDVAVGGVIERLGVGDDPERAFYERQDRMLQAKILFENGTVTSTHEVPSDEITRSLAGCEVTYDAVGYDAATGSAEVDVRVGDGADCDGVTLTLAGYELPGDDTVFVRAHAPGQELLASETVSLDAGESKTVTIDLDGKDEGDGDGDGNGNSDGDGDA